MPGEPTEIKVFHPTGGVAADDVMRHSELQQIPEVAKALQEHNTSMAAPKPKTPIYDSGRETVLKDLAKSGFNVDDEKSYSNDGSTIHDKYTTKLTEDEKKYIKEQQSKTQDDVYLSDVNKHITNFDAARTPKERKAVKAELKAYLDNLKAHEPDRWGRIKDNITQQWEKINKPEKDLQAQRQAPAVPTTTTPTPTGTTTPSPTDNVLVNKPIGAIGKNS